MSFGVIIALLLVLIALWVGLFSVVNDPSQIDAEEEKDVERRLGKKRRWFRKN